MGEGEEFPGSILSWMRARRGDPRVIPWGGRGHREGIPGMGLGRRCQEHPGVGRRRSNQGNPRDVRHLWKSKNTQIWGERPQTHPEEAGQGWEKTAK